VAHVSAAPEIARSETAPAAASRPPATPARADAPALARRFALRLGNQWLPRAAWTISRTGRPGLAGIALLLAAALFLFSTHLEVAAEVQALRKDLAAAQSQARTQATEKVADPATAIRVLPARTDMPAILRQLFDHATRARLAVDTAKYEINASGSGGIVRHQIAFPVAGPYPQIRAFIDATLATMPAIALSDLVLDRKSIADGRVEAQIRLTAYTVATGATGLPEDGSPPAYTVATGTMGPPGDGAAAPARQVTSRVATPRGSKALPESNRVVASTQEAALFAQHSWYVLPPPAPPAPPPPPLVPTAPPFPYTFMGSFSPEGHPQVFFLARGDRVIDAHVGDRIDGVYQFESAAGGQLVFVYLPLDVRQTLAIGASQ
jgi:Tfp pilus assembly protein PilO